MATALIYFGASLVFGFVCEKSFPFFLALTWPLWQPPQILYVIGIPWIVLTVIVTAVATKRNCWSSRELLVLLFGPLAMYIVLGGLAAFTHTGGGCF